MVNNYQPFRDHLLLCRQDQILVMEIEMAPHISVIFNRMIRLGTREDAIKCVRHESIRSYKTSFLLARNYLTYRYTESLSISTTFGIGLYRLTLIYRYKLMCDRLFAKCSGSVFCSLPQNKCRTQRDVKYSPYSCSHDSQCSMQALR